MQELHRFMMHCLGADKHDQLVGYGVTVGAMAPAVILFMRFTETHQSHRDERHLGSLVG